jgi:hypothetical protein
LSKQILLEKLYQNNIQTVLKIVQESVDKIAMPQQLELPKLNLPKLKLPKLNKV